MDVAKVIHIVSSSSKSFDDAVQEGIKKAGKSLHGIRGAKVTDMSCKVKDNNITEYRVTLDVAFHLDE